MIIELGKVNEETRNTTFVGLTDHHLYMWIF